MDRFFSNLKGKTVGILGLGYIGNALLNYLQALPLDIRLFGFSRENYADVGRYQYDFFFNCAGNTGDFRENLTGTIHSNLTQTIDLLNRIEVLQAYVGLSSTRVYGFSNNKDKQHNESHWSSGNHLDPEYIYDGSKKLLESLLINTNPNHKSNIVVARLSNVYDSFSEAELNNATLLKLIFASKRSGKKLLVRQNQESSKDYIHIDDCVEGIIRCALFGDGGHIYNIARGKSTSLKEIAIMLNPLLEFENSHRANHCSISIEKAHTNLGFSPTKNLLEISA